jgi:hypothetical protein
MTPDRMIRCQAAFDTADTPSELAPSVHQFGASSYSLPQNTGEGVRRVPTLNPLRRSGLILSPFPSWATNYRNLEVSRLAGH